MKDGTEQIVTIQKQKQRTAPAGSELVRYSIKGIDCAACALSLEAKLRSYGGLEAASVNFATETITFPEARVEDVKRIVSKEEPGVVLALPGQTAGGGGQKVARDEAAPAAKSRLLAISVSALAFFVLLALHDTIHESAVGWLEWPLSLGAWLIAGWGVLQSAIRNAGRGRIFDENFLMSIATIGAFVIHQLPEAVGVMLFYTIGEWFQERAVSSSRRSIKALVDLRPDTARVREGIVNTIRPAESVEAGSLVEIRAGERVPLDGIVVEGCAWVDTASLTGESVPRRVEPESEISAGFLVMDAVLVIRTTASAFDSAAARVIKMVEEASDRKSRSERLISRFAAIYTPLVVFGAAVVAVVPPILAGGTGWSDWVYRALVFLVISCPCALVISIPLGYFGGIGAASRRGILVKGGEYLDLIARVKSIAFDKTGTLTEGSFTVTGIVPFASDVSQNQMLALAAALESSSNHPVASAITKAARERFLRMENATGIEEVRGQGLRGLIDGKTVLAGNGRLFEAQGIVPDRVFVEGLPEGTYIHVAFNFRHLGTIVVSDRIRPSTPEAIRSLRSLGIGSVVMLTGDRAEPAVAIAEQAGITDVRYELRPEDKLSILESYMENPAHRPTAFVGDGINDAPVLTRADVGIAIGGIGSEAAIEAADIVLMRDDPALIPDGIRIARFTRRVIFQNIAMAFIVKGLFLTLGGFGMADLWEAIIADVGVALLSVLNATRILRAGKAAHPQV